MTITMKRPLLVLFWAFAVGTLATACSRGGNEESMSGAGETPMISITAPMEGAEVAANTPLDLVYEVHKSPSGDHVHIVVDDGKPAVVHRLKGTYELPGLSSGKHIIRIIEVTGSHSPTGVEAMVHVTVR